MHHDFTGHHGFLVGQCDILTGISRRQGGHQPAAPAPRGDDHVDRLQGSRLTMTLRTAKHPGPAALRQHFPNFTGQMYSVNDRQFRFEPSNLLAKEAAGSILPPEHHDGKSLRQTVGRAVLRPINRSIPECSIASSARRHPFNFRPS